MREGARWVAIGRWQALELGVGEGRASRTLDPPPAPCMNASRSGLVRPWMASLRLTRPTAHPAYGMAKPLARSFGSSASVIARECSWKAALALGLPIIVAISSQDRSAYWLRRITSR